MGKQPMRPSKEVIPHPGVRDALPGRGGFGLVHSQLPGVGKIRKGLESEEYSEGG